MEASTTNNRRAWRRRTGDAHAEFLYCSEMTPGSYVKFSAGRYVGLYGWVIDRKFDGVHWMVAVSDRLPGLGGAYRWFRATDVWLASHEDRENQP